MTDGFISRREALNVLTDSVSDLWSSRRSHRCFAAGMLAAG